MSLARRELMAAAAAAGVAAVTGGARAAEAERTMPVIAPPKKPAVLKIASQEGPMAGGSLKEKLDNMEKWGFVGLEPGGRGLPGRVKEIKDALKGRPIQVSAVCAGFEGVLISEKPESREKAMSTMKEILSAAGELGSTGMIMVPAFHNQTTLRDEEGRKLLVELLGQLGEHAVKAGTRVLLEPLNRRECYFLRQVADAAAIARDVNSPGVAIMGDFWHMTWEETSDMGAFVSGGDYLHNVHIASRKQRKMPGEDGPADNYVQGFKGLKLIGYQDYISLECGSIGDKMQTIPAAAKLIRDQWAQA